MDVRRGDMVTVVTSGDYGKPRPALVIQDDAFADLPSLTVLPLTSDLRPAPLIRIDVPPSRGSGLRSPSQIMIDKATTVPRAKVGGRIGRLDDVTIGLAAQALSRFLGIA